MGRANIAECGRRFTSEYQPAGRGRPKGSLNRQTILRAYLEEREPPAPEEVIRIILDEVFGKKRTRRRRNMSGANKKA
jgi:hypothetical protein